MPTPEQKEATTELLAACESLLASAEASLALLPIVAPQVTALLREASKAGLCSMFVIRKLEARLRLVERMDFGRCGLPPVGPTFG